MLQNALGKVRSDTNELLELAERVGNEYLRGEAPGQSEIVERACVFDFLLHTALLFRDWLDRTEPYLTKANELSKSEAEALALTVFKKNMLEYFPERPFYSSSTF